MKVFLRPTGLCAGARAMLRVVEALSKYAPSQIQITTDPAQADLTVLHVIGPDAVPPARGAYAVIQYCGYADRHNPAYAALWRDAAVVWSYYPLDDAMPEQTTFMHAPLGLDDEFRKQARWGTRNLTIMSSGYTTGPAAEAIEEVALAVDAVGGQMVHIGPKTIEGMTRYPACFQTQHGMPDSTLASLYRATQRVSGLRQVEGFELPALEGYVQGARPVVFDRPDTRQWYEGRAEFVPPCHGPELIDRLTHLLRVPPTPVTREEIAKALQDFDWSAIAPAFWEAVLLSRRPSVQIIPGVNKRRLLWIGDAITATGYERSTRYVTRALMRDFDVHILGLNYHGDPHDYPCKVYPCTPGGDGMGYGRTRAMVQNLVPSVIVVQNDPWNVQEYLKRINAANVGAVPTIGYIAVDGKNCAGTELNGLAKAVFWTEFAREEAKLGGYTGPSAVVPLGVDREMYRPMDRAAIRDQWLAKALTDRGLPADTFVVGVVGRNQWRKRLDLVIQYFAEWVHKYQINDAVLWIHSAPTGDDAWDLKNLARYHGVGDRVLVPMLTRNGLDEAGMACVYNLFDVLFTATMGEGMWLPGLEAAASGVPIMAPNWSAIGELFDDAGLLIACTSTAAHPNQVCVVGGVMDRTLAIEGLHYLYKNRPALAEYAAAGIRLATERRFDWQYVGEAFRREVLMTLGELPVAIPTGELVAR